MEQQLSQDLVARKRESELSDISDLALLFGGYKLGELYSNKGLKMERVQESKR